MTDQEYKNLRSEALANLAELLATPKSSIQDGMNAWTAFAQASKFLSLAHSLNSQALDPYAYDDEEGRLQQVDFYDTEHSIKQAWDEYEYQEMLKENAFAIGYVDFLDEFIFCCTDFNHGIAIIHHDDVFCTDDIDQLVARKQKSFNCSIEKLLKALERKE